MTLLLSADTVLTGPAGVAIADGAVLVDGPTIVAVGPRAALEERADGGVERRHHAGATLLPGLIDAHVHLAFTPGVPIDTPDPDVATTTAAHARELLDAGVTTARDLGGPDDAVLAVRDAVITGELPGPRLLVAGSPLTIPQGHCWWLGGEVPPGDEAALRAAVRARADAGVDWIKVMASGGQYTPAGVAMWERQFDEADLRVIVDEAERHGLRVAVHAHGVDSITDAAAAGVGSVEHASWMSGPGTSEHRPEVAAAMVAGGTAACTGSSGDGRIITERAGPERARELMGRMRWVADQGVRVVLGTDAGLNPFDTLPRSLAHWTNWGFTPAETIEAATVTAASVLGLADVTGRLAPGLAADVLVVSGDPLADPHAVACPELVVVGGRVHEVAG